jgi:hypothetical protein
LIGVAPIIGSAFSYQKKRHQPESPGMQAGSLPEVHMPCGAAKKL